MRRMNPDTKALMAASTEFCLSRTAIGRHGAKHLQRGAIALALMLMLGLTVSLLVIGYARSVRGNDVVDPRTNSALSKAREALLGYATTYRETHPGETFGYFPCPDMGTGNEGQAASACGGTDVTVIGRIPWRTLDLPPLRDASGECLWYAISGNYKNNPKTNDLVNRDTNGLIEVMAADGSGFIAGATPAQRAMAVIFAPGPILPGQDRSLAATNPPTVCGGNYVPANYLDSDVSSGIDNAAAAGGTHALSRFIAAEHADLTPATNDAFNDRLMAILPEELFMRHLERRADFESDLTDPLTGMLRKAADCLLAYGLSNDDGPAYKLLPYAASLNVSAFGNSANYADANNMRSGRLPLTVSFSASNGFYNNDDGTPVNYVSVPLLNETACPGWNSVDEFWENWKDHLFYAVADAHRSGGLFGWMDDPCGESYLECIDIEDPDTIRTNFAAVVIFAGAKQSGQTRDNDVNPSYTSADKADPANYLEGINVTSIQTNPGLNAPNRLFSKTAGNDSMMCLYTPLPGSPTSLAIDPTCGATAACTSDGSLLAAYRAGSTNNCRVGSSGIDSTCRSLGDRIHINNCPGDGTTFDPNGQPYSCKRGAREFLSYECLEGFATARCQLAYTALTKCQ